MCRQETELLNFSREDTYLMFVVSLSLPYLLTEMTEEEQFALALKMSEQEAREVNSQEAEEEELLRKAIAESLNVNMLC